ncbi:MAG: cysteine-rich KTR domain-containing protein [Oscillospiraceae bacterium]
MTEWVKCPVCGNKTRDKIRTDTVIENLTLYCPKCKPEALINVRDMTVSVQRINIKQN